MRGPSASNGPSPKIRISRLLSWEFNQVGMKKP